MNTQSPRMLEAYRDDADFTAPEMEPGHGEDIHPAIDPADALAGVAASSIGLGGGAFVGAVLRGIADERLPDAGSSS